MKCASFFSGVGGIDVAFKNAGFDIVYANEYDEYAIKTYKNNFKINVDNRDIHNVDENEVPDFEVMLAGFPCQAFSIAGYREGFDDKKGRGNLFFELVRFIKAKKPRIVFLENVKNLYSHDKGNTFNVIIKTLKQLGYDVDYSILNATNYGDIPQNRERLYIVAFINNSDYENFHFPKPIELKTSIQKVIDFEANVDKKYYYNESSKIYSKLKEVVKNKNTIYQWRRVYVRENKSNVCPTLTANMGTGGHNVPIILTNDNKIRKLTPRECFNLQGFSREYNLPKEVSDTRLYKQAGNSVVVPVVSRIANNIISLC